MKHCLLCGAPFTPAQPHQIYCSVKCRMRAKWQRQHAARVASIPPARCPICGVEFTPQKHRRYCSEACSEQANRINCKERHRRANAKRAKKPGIERRGRKRLVAPYTARRMLDMRERGMTIEAISQKVQMNYATVQHALANIDAYLAPPGEYVGLRYEDYIRASLELIT